MFSKRRGVSEMVAVILVLIIVTVAGTILYRYSLETIGGQYTTLSNQVNSQVLAAGERFEIVAVEQLSTNSIKVYILNFSPTKTIDITLSEVYINGISVTPVDLSSNEIKISHGEVRDVTIDLVPDDFILDKLYNIYVVSQRGVGNGYEWKA